MKPLTPKIALDFLSEEYDLANQSQQAKFLDLTQGRISQIKTSATFTKATLKSLLRGTFSAGNKKGQSSANSKLLETFGQLRGLTTQQKIAKVLKKTPGAVAQWKLGYEPISQNVISAILSKANLISIQELAEMKEVEPGKPGGKWYLFHDKNDARRRAILDPLKCKRGVYCYFDSRGHLTYVGKADRTPLEKEIEARLNAKVSQERLPYRKDLRKHKQTLRQGEMVKFVSAYEVSPKAVIPLVEALLIRVTANMQYNNRLENLRNL